MGWRAAKTLESSPGESRGLKTLSPHHDRQQSTPKTLIFLPLQKNGSCCYDAPAIRTSDEKCEVTSWSIPIILEVCIGLPALSSQDRVSTPLTSLSLAGGRCRACHVCAIGERRQCIQRRELRKREVATTRSSGTSSEVLTGHVDNF